MPAPTNTSAATAIIIPSLPYSNTQQVDDAGTIYTVWYAYVATVADQWAGLYSRGAATYEVEFTVYTGSAVTPTPIGVDGENVPAQFVVIPGDTYFFKFAPVSGSVGTANLTVELERGPNENVPPGTIAVNDDTEGFPVVFVDVNGDILRQVPDFPAGEAGDVLDDGTVCVHDTWNDRLVIFDAQYNQTHVESSINISSLVGALRTCQGTQRFWFCTAAGSVRTARYIESDGTLGTAHTLTAITNVAALAASNDETILYHVAGGNNQAIRRWDLVNDVALSDLTAGVASYQTADILVLADNTIVATYIKTSATIDVQVRRYNAAGALQNTYNFGAAQLFPFGTLPRLAYDPASTSFWIWTHPSGALAGFSKFEQVRVADGVILQTVTPPQFEIGVYQPTSGTPEDERFGVSFSCPFWITRVAFPESGTGTIIVNKVVIPDDDLTEFDFTAGGGLSPSSFTLQGGGQRVFNSVAAGDGYSIAEDPVTAFTTTIEVSNGSPADNITVEADETVVVTVTNSRVIFPAFETEEDPRRWLRRSPIMGSENRRVGYSLFRLDMQVGVGQASGETENVDPHVMMRYSDDAGYTWSNELWRPMGRLGKYSTLIDWWRLGQGRNRVFEVSGSAAVRTVLLDGYCDVEPSEDAPKG